MMEVVPFRIEHLHAILHATPERVMWKGIQEAHLAGLDNGHAVTGMIDGMPVVCGGLILMWDGLAEGWLATTPTATAHGFWLTRNVIRFVRAKAIELGLRRVQAHVDSTFIAAWQWLDRLGLQRESEMLHYGPKGQSYYMYVWYPQ